MREGESVLQYLVLLEELWGRLMLISLSDDPSSSSSSGPWEWSDRVSSLAASWSRLSIFRSFEQSPSNWKLGLPSSSPSNEGETSEDEVKLGANFSFHFGLLKLFWLFFRFVSFFGMGQADIDREETAGQGEKFVFSGDIILISLSLLPPVNLALSVRLS